MPARKRRAPAQDEGEDEVPTPTQTQRNRRGASPSEGDEEVDEPEEETQNGSGSIAQLSKSLVRYALACEYARIPIKRPDVNQKVLGSHSREFKKVFDAADGQLLDVFGMQMVELPNREKHTMRQKRAAAASESQSKASNQWVLRTALPDNFRTSSILTPPSIPTAESESAYVGLYTTVIALILLSGGRISESKLDRYLKRMNADQSTPAGSTVNMMAKMIKEGYIDKVKDTSAGEELIDYVVGPRGKVEVGEDAVANFVRTVYVGADVEDLDKRLNRSLQVTDGDASRPQATNGVAAATADSTPRRGPGRPARRPREEDEDE